MPTLKLPDMAAMNQYEIPEYMQASIVRYIEQGIKPGHFLSAIIENDLAEAVARADGRNRVLIPSYVKWFYNHAPSACWGYSGATTEWRRKIIDKELVNKVMSEIGKITGERQ